MAKLLSWLSRRRPVAGLVGFEATGDGVALAHMRPVENTGDAGPVAVENAAGIPIENTHDAAFVERGGRRLQLRSCEFISCAGDSEARAELLRERVAALGLVSAPCNIVLPSSNYQLLLVEAPKVPLEELRDAVRWRIKELIHSPMEDTVVDVFALPEGSSRGSANMVYAVAAQRRAVTEAIGMAEAAGLRVESIDIGEMALRNLAETCADDSRGIAVVKLARGTGSLALIRQGNLYLSRQFDLDYNAGLLDDIPGDSLVLELQRSLDYYERQMGQAPPATILLGGENVSADKITDSMRTGLTAQVGVLAVGPRLTGVTPIDESVLQLCLGAVGAALRRPEAA